MSRGKVRGSLRSVGIPDDTLPKTSHYQATFKLAGSGIARVNLDGSFIDINERFCELMGYSQERLLGMRFQDLTFPEDLHQNTDYLEKIASGEIDHYRLQKRYIRSNGEILWADLTVVADKDIDGQVVSLISIVSDIRAFKNTEERMDFLLGELAHRSKNLFAVVLSVINQTDADHVDDFRTLIQQRIHSLAASQDLLLGRNIPVSSFSDLVTEQIRAFVSPDDPRITRNIAHVDLGAGTTRVLGMAIHELATNSCKYGALSRLSGRLTIACEIDRSDADRVAISWVERGGPTVSPPERAGFGRKVIERMVARSLNADIQLRFDPEGLAWQCHTRLENLQL